MTQDYLHIPVEALVYLKICCFALVIIAACRIVEFIENIRLSGIKMNTARLEEEAAFRALQDLKKRQE